VNPDGVAAGSAIGPRSTAIRTPEADDRRADPAYHGLEMAAKQTGKRSPSAASAASPQPHEAADRDHDDGRLAAAEVAAERMAAATRRVAGRAADAAGAVVEAADGVVEALKPAAEHLAATTRDAAVEGARHLPRSSRRRPVPLPNLYDVHPEARDAPLRELGLMSIPIDEIVGTAVRGAAQRGLDFQPLPAFRSKNWEARWQRIRRATQEMRSLPPIDVLRARDGYWVTDGHNRVAAAKVVGQVELDADVKGVVLPGEPIMRPSGSLAPVLAESSQIEAAARGQLSRGTTLGRTVQERDLGPRPGDADDPGPGAADRDGAEPAR
jgi:hypothetical protein